MGEGRTFAGLTNELLVVGELEKEGCVFGMGGWVGEKKMEENEAIQMNYWSL